MGIEVRDYYRRVAQAALCLGLTVAVGGDGLGTASAQDLRQVETVAGTGAIGFADGPALRATFSTPSDIARAADGTLYISDEAAERIRVLTPDGTVQTVAGSGSAGELGLSVPGGYRDGAAHQALFNHPLGMAVGPDGALFIADSKNQCIRKLYRGQVSTVAGMPGSTAPIDGPVVKARFVWPHALAFDRKGRLWIADYGVGLRRLDPDGTVTTIQLRSFSDNGITSISISPDIDDPVLIAVTLRIVFVYHISSGTDTFFDNVLPAEGSARPFGRPVRIVAIGHGQALFTDGQSSNIHYMRLPAPPFLSTPFTRIIAGGDHERGIDNAGFADGDRAQARFYSPRGLIKVDDSVIVVDSGNRMIRRIILPNTRLPETGLSADYHYDDAHFEIAYVGPSVTFWDSFGDDSICATIENRVDASHLINKRARCHTVRIDGPTVQQIFDYVTNYLSFQPVDIIVIPVDPGSCLYGGFRTAREQLLSRLNKRTRLVFVWQQNYYAVSNDESLVQKETVNRLDLYPDDVHAEIVANLNAVKVALSGLPVFAYASYDDFLKYETQPIHQPETHFNPRGNAFMGDRVGDYLVTYVIGK